MTLLFVMIPILNVSLTVDVAADNKANRILDHSDLPNLFIS